MDAVVALCLQSVESESVAFCKEGGVGGRGKERHLGKFFAVIPAPGPDTISSNTCRGRIRSLVSSDKLSSEEKGPSAWPLRRWCVDSNACSGVVGPAPFQLRVDVRSG